MQRSNGTAAQAGRNLSPPMRGATPTRGSGGGARWQCEAGGNLCILQAHLSVAPRRRRGREGRQEAGAAGGTPARRWRGDLGSGNVFQAHRDREAHPPGPAETCDHGTSLKTRHCGGSGEASKMRRSEAAGRQQAPPPKDVWCRQEAQPSRHQAGDLHLETETAFHSVRRSSAGVLCETR